MRTFRVFAPVLALILLLGCAFPAAAEEQPPFTCGNYGYDLRADGTAVIFTYDGPGGTITIPDDLDGHPVSAVHDGAFQKLIDGGLPFSLATGPDHPYLAAYDGVLYGKTDNSLICYPPLRNMTEYRIRPGTERIAAYAFFDCYKLKNVVIPDSVTFIGEGAFEYCSDLASITIPESVTAVGAYAFADCDALTDITVPAGIGVIDEGVFSYCDALTSVTISEGITRIGTGAFFECKALTDVSLPDSVTLIDPYAFASCESLAAVVIPEGTTRVGGYAFAGCTALTSVNLPLGVNNIGSFVFQDVPDVVITVARDSYAADWCAAQGLSCVYADAPAE